jgi:hypothetical protein
VPNDSWLRVYPIHTSHILLIKDRSSKNRNGSLLRRNLAAASNSIRDRKGFFCSFLSSYYQNLYSLNTSPKFSCSIFNYCAIKTILHVTQSMTLSFRAGLKKELIHELYPSPLPRVRSKRSAIKQQIQYSNKED